MTNPKNTEEMPVLPASNLIKTADLCALLECSPSTLCRWAARDHRIKAARRSPGFYRIDALREAGLLR